MDTLTILLLNDAILILIAYVFLRVLMGKLPETIDFLQQKLKMDVELWLNSEKGAKALYQVGGLIGHGAVAGSGLQKTSGKFKWENLIGDLVTRYIQGKNPLGQFGGQQTEAPPRLPERTKPGLSSA